MNPLINQEYPAILWRLQFCKKYALHQPSSKRMFYKFKAYISQILFIFTESVQSSLVITQLRAQFNLN